MELGLSSNRQTKISDWTVNNTTMRRRGLDKSGCPGSSSTLSGVQWTPSIIVPSLMAIKCRLWTSPSIVAMYLEQYHLVSDDHSRKTGWMIKF